MSRLTDQEAIGWIGRIQSLRIESTPAGDDEPVSGEDEVALNAQAGSRRRTGRWNRHLIRRDRRRGRGEQHGKRSEFLRHAAARAAGDTPVEVRLPPWRSARHVLLDRLVKPGHGAGDVGGTERRLDLDEARDGRGLLLPHLLLPLRVHLHRRPGDQRGEQEDTEIGQARPPAAAQVPGPFVHAAVSRKLSWVGL